MRRFLLFLILIVTLSACASMSTATSMPTPSPTLTKEAKATVTPTETPSPSPSLTPVPPSLILADFPLAVGATWVYAAKISYQDPDNYMKLVTWTGIVTDKVVKRTRLDNASIFFTIQEEMKPAPPSDVWRQPGTFTYIMTGNGVFNGRMKIYQWPLKDDTQWQTFTDFPNYETLVNRSAEVNTPYKKFENCYTFLTPTNPDINQDIFCPGVGIVSHYYSHHGTPQN